MIKDNVKEILEELPEGIILVAAAKTRTPDEINQAVDAGIKIIGENYVQEAEEAFNVIGNKVKWHFIGHLQKNKVKKAVRIFDMIETVDSVKIAEEINKRCAHENKVMEVLVEINSGTEEQKFGVFPDKAEELIRQLADLSNIKVMGVMTMAPYFEDPEKCRSYFNKTREIFNKIKASNIESIQMRYLSMGMTDSYKVAIAEGANMVRIGTRIFGTREYKK